MSQASHLGKRRKDVRSSGGATLEEEMAKISKAVVEKVAERFLRFGALVASVHRIFPSITHPHAEHKKYVNCPTSSQVLCPTSSLNSL